eukprot:1198530-Pyramimonas_sp.AAC.1
MGRSNTFRVAGGGGHTTHTCRLCNTPGLERESLHLHYREHFALLPIACDARRTSGGAASDSGVGFATAEQGPHGPSLGPG